MNARSYLTGYAVATAACSMALLVYPIQEVVETVFAVAFAGVLSAGVLLQMGRL